MDLSIPVRVEMKYAGGSLAVATWDDRRPICVRRPEATGALLMRGPDSSLSLRRGSCTWHVQMSSVASLVPSTPDMPADFSPQTSSAQNASSGAPDGFSPFEKSPFDVASKSCRIKRCYEDFVERSARRNRRNVSRNVQEFKSLKSNEKRRKGKFVEREIILGEGKIGEGKSSRRMVLKDRKGESR